MSKPRQRLFSIAVLLLLPTMSVFQRNASGGVVRNSAVPTITAYSPTSVTAGAATFTISVTGTNFVAGSTTVVWSGPASGNMSATVTGSTSLTASVPASLVAKAGNASFYVSVAGRNGGNSNVVPFTIGASAGGTGGTGGTTSPLAIATAAVPSGTQGAAYSTSLSASGGTSPYTWTATTTLPAGLTLASTGAISGTPTASGSYSFSVQVKDASAATQSATYAVSIGASTVTLSITPATLSSATAGSPYSATLSASGGTSPYAWSLTAGSTLPAGLTLSSAGALSGTPTTANNYSFSVTAADSASHTATQAYTMTVAAASTTGVVFQTGFEATDPAFDYSYGSSDISITAAPPVAFSGNALQVHYHMCGNPVLSPGLAQLAAGTLPQQAIYVKYTYLSATGETSASAEAAVTVLANNVIVVNSPPPAENMLNYNIYAAMASGAEVLQNTTPIPIGTNWTGPLTGLVTGAGSPPAANAAGCGGASQDTNRWVSKVISPGLTTIYTRGYVFVKTPEPTAPQGVLMQRKLIWLGDSTSAANNVSGNYQVVLDSWNSSAGVVIPTMNLSVLGQPSNGSTCGPPAYQVYSVATGMSYNTWTEVEFMVQLNTPGVSDGVLKVWLNGVQTYTNSAMNFRGSCTTPISFVGIGEQANRYNYNAADEYRFWDNIAVSGSYIP